MQFEITKGLPLPTRRGKPRKYDIPFQYFDLDLDSYKDKTGWEIEIPRTYSYFDHTWDEEKYKKVEQIYNWAAQRYGLTILKSEDKWRKKYPNIAKKVDEQELRIKSLEDFFPSPDDHNAGK